MMNTIRSTSRHRNICSSSFLAANVKEMSPKLRAKRINRDDPDKTLSFQRSDNGTRDSEFLVDSGSGNPFYQVISTLTPGELVGQFISSASPRVQSAVKNTILGLLGSLRSAPAFDSSVVTSQRALANMMFQLEMTGYMFRNAEYRLAVQQSLARALPPSDSDRPAADADLPLRVSGQISVHIPNGGSVEVSADSYISELSKEIQRLRSELVNLRQQQVEDTGRDLLGYITAMEEEDMASLTSSVSREVLEAMKLLVDSVLRGINDQPAGLAPSDALTTELPSGTLAQLCMWQLVVGYNLRELEARDELNKSLPA